MSLFPEGRGNEQRTSVKTNKQTEKTRICTTTVGSSLGLQSRKQNRTIFQVLLCYCLCNVLKTIFQMIHLQIRTTAVAVKMKGVEEHY